MFKPYLCSIVDPQETGTILIMAESIKDAVISTQVISKIGVVCETDSFVKVQVGKAHYISRMGLGTRSYPIYSFQADTIGEVAGFLNTSVEDIQSVVGVENYEIQN